MSREIKFEYIIKIETRDGDEFIKSVFTLGEIESRTFTHKKENVIAVRQCTGLKDKNGVEICEGDIVKIEMDKNNFELAKINFNVNDGMYEVDFIGYDCIEHFNDWIKISHFEVIGNIHQNKDLLC